MTDRTLSLTRPVIPAAGTMIACLSLLLTTTAATAQDLQSFAVISGQTVTNTGPTTIDGNIAVSPGTAYTGRDSVTQTGSIFLGDAVAVRIQNDLTTLYTFLAGRPTSSNGDLSGQDLAGQTLQPGVYHFDSSANLANGGILTLDAGGNPDAVFIFNIGSALTIGTAARINLIGQAQGGNVFFRVGSSATIGTDAGLEGQVVALTSITMNTDALINCGAVYARNGSVTLDSNTIAICRLTTTNVVLPQVPTPVTLALAEVVNTGGALPIGIAVLLATQTPDELAVSLAQLSGEVATGLAPTGLRAMDGFLDVVMGRGTRPGLQAIAPRDQNVPPLMVEDKVNAPYLGGKASRAAPVAATAPLAFATMLAEPAQPFNVWVSAYGSRQVTDGDAAQGQHRRTSDTRGLALGLNYAPQASTDIGVALSWNTSDFTLDDTASSGSADAVFAALRGRVSSTSGYLAGAIAIGRHDLATERSVTIAGLDRLQGQTQADHVAAHVEAGYHLGNITPFAGLRAQSFTTDGYAETATAGVDTYALGYGSQTTRSLRSELGVQMQWDSAATSLGLRAAWAHEFEDQDALRGALVTASQIGFPVSGATRDRDQLLLAASIGSTLDNGVFVQGGVNGAYAGNARDLGGSVSIGYRW